MSHSFKIKAAVLVMASCIGLGSGAFAATSTVTNAGTVHFQGKVIAAGCAVASDSVDQTVNLGVVKVGHFTGADVAGDQKTSFNINLTDCDSTTASNATLKFNGTSVNTTGGAAVLENLSRGVDAATGVGIRLFDTNGSALEVGTDGAPVNLVSGNNTLVFSADYISTDTTVTAGDVTATTTFDITYS